MHIGQHDRPRERHPFTPHRDVPCKAGLTTLVRPFPDTGTGQPYLPCQVGLTPDVRLPLPTLSGCPYKISDFPVWAGFSSELLARQAHTEKILQENLS